MTARAVRDPRFRTGDLVRLTAAVAGISRDGWTAVTGSPSADDGAKNIMAEGRFDVLPIETGSSVEAYFHTLKWNDYSQIARATISQADLIPYDTDVREVVRRLAVESRLFYFLHDGQEVVGLISVVNLNRRPVKVWLFNLLSEVEVRLGEFLSKHCKDSEICSLTLGRSIDPKYDQVKVRLETDRKNGLDLPMVEYLYFTDLVDVLLLKGLHGRLGFSRIGFKRALGSLAELRDEVAHPVRSLVRGPEAVPKLWRRVQRIDDALDILRRSLTRD